MAALKWPHAASETLWMVLSKSSKTNYSNHHYIHQRTLQSLLLLSKGHAFNEGLKDQTKTEDSLCKIMTIRNAEKKKKRLQEAR